MAENAVEGAAESAGNMLSRRVGPLPIWGWGVLAAGTIGAVQFLRSQSVTPSEETAPTPTTGRPLIPSTGEDAAFLALQGRLEQLQDTLEENFLNPPDSGGVNICPPGTVFEPTRRECISVCAPGQIWNAELQRCLNLCTPPLVFDDATGKCRQPNGNGNGNGNGSQPPPPPPPATCPPEHVKVLGRCIRFTNPFPRPTPQPTPSPSPRPRQPGSGCPPDRPYNIIRRQPDGTIIEYCGASPNA